MKISGNSSFNPMLFAQSQKGRMPSSDASAMQRAIEQAGEGQGPNGIMMAGNSQPPVDANTILENWGTSNAIADLNVDGIVDAQDLAMVLHAAQGAPAGGEDDSPGDEWSSLVGGDLNGDGTIDAMDLAMKLNAETPESGGGSNDSPADDPTSPSIGMVDAAELIGAIGAMPPDTSPADMLERLTNLIFKAFDTDGDGVLTEANVPDNTKVFARFDADGSGALHRNELLKGLTEEYQRALETSDQIAPGPFAKRWLETFSGLMPIPTYTSPMQLEELYSAPKPSGAASLTPNILSAQA
jgi:Ca2+-binding EF-hand superfamily protein